MARELYGYRLRPHQAQVLEQALHGRTTVSAVPGSGKTLVLSLLAARLIIEGHIGPQSEVLVVTVQNAAVANISHRIRDVLRQQGLPAVGFRVCTLHKLAHDIVRQRQDLAGVADDFFIIDEGESRRTLQNAANRWVSNHREWWQSFMPEGANDYVSRRWLDETIRVGREVTKQCKHRRWTPDQAREETAGLDDPFVGMGVALYALYEQYLEARSGLDFDDLIWRAIDALGQDATFRENLRHRWPHILEDEAQDSSPLQEEILEMLSGEGGNWVRVGDPNQSINSTFTSADPRFFRRFASRPDVTALSLPQSGRCARPIIRLANHLVAWACAEHPEPEMRALAFEEQYIAPTDTGDPQPNPASEECHVHIAPRPYADVEVEAGTVSGWAASYQARYPDRTMAILCPTAPQGEKVVAALQAMTPAVAFDDLLRSTPRTRDIAGMLAAACAFLGQPTSQSSLSDLFAVYVSQGVLAAEAREALRMRHLRTVLRSMQTNQLLFPRDGTVFGDLLPRGVTLTDIERETVARYAELVARWVRASALPVDQLILTMAQDLYAGRDDVASLAICHTMAGGLRATSQMHPDWHLDDFAIELRDVARNRRALAGLSLADAGYVPQPGHIVVTTMHKSKGLEWDAVYLTSVDNLEYPETRADAFRDELFVMPGRAPATEARVALERLGGIGAPSEGEDPLLAKAVSADSAHLEYIAERLRLLYVGITRARRDLALTWSAERSKRKLEPAQALLELRAYRETADLWEDS